MDINLERNEQSKENNNEVSNQQPLKKCIRCPECGEEILMVPTLGEMIEVIENHVELHKKHPKKDVPFSHIKTPTIRIDLTQQVLVQASDMMDLPRKPSLSL
jgi:hypothetical protein